MLSFRGISVGLALSFFWFSLSVTMARQFWTLLVVLVVEISRLFKRHVYSSVLRSCWPNLKLKIFMPFYRTRPKSPVYSSNRLSLPLSTILKSLIAKPREQNCQSTLCADQIETSTSPHPGHLNFWRIRLDRSNSHTLGPKWCSNALPYRRILSDKCSS